MDYSVIRGLMKSRTFWMNTATIAIESGSLFGILGIPPGTITLINAFANIVLRTMTNSDVRDK